MLRLAIIILLVSVALATAAFGQVTAQPKAILGYQVDEWLNWNLNGGELLLDHIELVRRPETKIAIRVCTELPLAEAIKQSKSPPFRIANFMKLNHGYTPERLLFLRSNECYRGEKIISAIEVWIVPQGAVLPSAEDTLKVVEAEAYLFRKKLRVRKKRQKSAVRSYWQAAPNNGMHPTRNSAALIIKGSSGRVMPGVRRL